MFLDCKMQEVVRNCRGVTDICLFSGGDVYPFHPQVLKSTFSISDWMAYRRRYSKVTFHCVGLCKERDSADLVSMAADGGGKMCLISQF
jgi:hypothetical protein